MIGSYVGRGGIVVDGNLERRGESNIGGESEGEEKIDLAKLLEDWPEDLIVTPDNYRKLLDALADKP